MSNYCPALTWRLPFYNIHSFVRWMSFQTCSHITIRKWKEGKIVKNGEKELNCYWRRESFVACQRPRLANWWHHAGRTDWRTRPFGRGRCRRGRAWWVCRALAWSWTCASTRAPSRGCPWCARSGPSTRRMLRPRRCTRSSSRTEYLGSCQRHQIRIEISLFVNTQFTKIESK